MSSLAPMHASSAARDANDFLAALGGNMQATGGAPTAQRVGLAPRTEFRFETEPETSVTITLASGTAEVFGAELVPRRPYTFADAQLAVFTWHGCTLDVVGSCGHSYVAEETPMASYLQLHNELEERRALAAAHGTSGPRVLVTGPKETGKSSLCRLLANYLVRNHRSALMVDLDVAQGDIAVPGCVAAASPKAKSSRGFRGEVKPADGFLSRRIRCTGQISDTVPQRRSERERCSSTPTF